MPRFQLGDEGIIAPSARAALNTNPCRAAREGAELCDSRGAVIARKGRVDFGDGFLIAWQALQGWPDNEPIVDLSQLQAEFVASASDLETDRGSSTDAKRGPAKARSVQRIAQSKAATLRPIASCGSDESGRGGAT